MLKPMHSHAGRPAGRTSSQSRGLPMFAAVLVAFGQTALAQAFAAPPAGELAKAASSAQIAVPIAEIASAAVGAPEIVTIPAPGMGSFGGDIAMHTLIYKPTGPGPHAVLLFSHGRATDAVARSKLAAPVGAGHVRYWLAKGYAVVAPIRPGYGATGGRDTEGSGVGYDSNGNCTSQPNPSKTANAAMGSVALALAWVRVQPWAKVDRILLEGQSVGGLTTVALCATNPPGVVGCINFAGGTGGNPERAPARMCAPEKTTALMRQYGSTTRLPNIWFYAPNDLFWGEQPPKDWHAAFSEGGSATQMVSTPPVQPDGHRLLAVGGRLWSQPLGAWLKENGL